MQCVTPMYRFYDATKEKDSNAKIVPREEVLNELEKDGNKFKTWEEFNNSIFNTNGHKYMKVRCKKCWACQLQYSAEWATKITLECEEAKYSNPVWNGKEYIQPANYFITLTYDDDHLPKADELINEETGEVYERNKNWKYPGILKREDIQTFLNSIRKHFERKPYYHTGIKVYYAGEYGEKTHRPHFHMILMNVPLDISQFYGTHIDENYKAHWKSKEVEKIWNKGMIDIAEVEWSCAAYVARYTMKKIGSGTKESYYEQGKTPEFVGMSRRPGIGMRYYERNKEKIYENDEIIQRTVKGNIGSVKPPKAWDNKFKEEFPKEWEMIKKSRQKALSRSQRLNKQMTDYTDYEMLKISARKVEEKGKMLPRPGEW